MKKIFVDVYLAFNLGDDLFVDILSKKYPNTEFTLNYVGNNYDDFLKQYENVSRREYSLKDKILQKLSIKDTLTDYKSIAREHDAMIFIGGSIFRDEDYHQELYNYRNCILGEFEKLKKPVFVLGANFGPYKNMGFLNDYKKFFRRCKDVCFRDKYSYNLFKELKNVRYAPDIVFQLDLDKYKKEEKNEVIGFSIIDVNHKQDIKEYEEKYIESTIKSIEVLISKGYECCLVSFCELEGDLKVIDNIISRLNDEYKSKIKVYKYDGDIDACIKIISNFKLFIAARFHANIIAQLLDIGLLPVIYSDKTLNMLKDIGKDELKIEMKNLEDLFKSEILEIAMNNNRFDIEKIKKESNLHFKKLTEFISK